MAYLDVRNIRTATYKRMYSFFVDILISVASPGCLFPDPNFSFPHPGSEESWIRIRIKEFNYLTKKIVLSSRK
jgi:hypothetical protein